MSKTVADILAACPLFALVRGASLARVRAMAVITRHAAGEVIFRQDEACPGLYVVGRGAVRIYKLSPAGKEHVLHVAEPGATFAEVAVIGDFPCPAFAEALASTTCVLLPKAALCRALREDHDLCLQLLGGMAVWVKHLVGLVESITLRDALGRVAHHLTNLTADAAGGVRLPGLKRHLASHLNLTSETLSRVLRRLKDDGIIESEGETLRIRDRVALETLAVG